MKQIVHNQTKDKVWKFKQKKCAIQQKEWKVYQREEQRLASRQTNATISKQNSQRTENEEKLLARRRKMQKDKEIQEQRKGN